MVFEVWNNLKKGDIHPVYCLYGKETYLLQETAAKLRQAVVDEETKDFNYSVFDMEEVPLEQAVTDAETFPFMGERRLVVIKNSFASTTAAFFFNNLVIFLRSSSFSYGANNTRIV